jgi:hypothetical protein
MRDETVYVAAKLNLDITNSVEETSVYTAFCRSECIHVSPVGTFNNDQLFPDYGNTLSFKHRDN